MRTLLFMLIIAGFVSCNTTDTTKGNNTETDGNKATPSLLNGNWELNHIHGYVLDSLYKNRRPAIQFEVDSARFSGNTSCNSYSGKLVVEGNKINFNEPITMTKMFCGGEGENVFLAALKKSEAYKTDNNELIFMVHDSTFMKFSRK